MVAAISAGEAEVAVVAKMGVAAGAAGVVRAAVAARATGASAAAVAAAKIEEDLGIDKKSS